MYKKINVGSFHNYFPFKVVANIFIENIYTWYILEQTYGTLMSTQKMHV